MKKIVFILSISMLSLSAMASDNGSAKGFETDLNGQSVIENGNDVEYRKVRCLAYDKSRKEFIMSDVNKYDATMYLNIVYRNGSAYFRDGNMKEYKVELNKRKEYGGMNVSGYRYMCDTFWQLLFFNFVD